MFQVPSSLSHIAVVIPGHGDKPLSQPGAFEPSLPRPALSLLCSRFQSPSILLAGVVFILSCSLRVLHCGGEWDAQRGLHAWFWCAESYVTLFLTGVLEPMDPGHYMVAM